MERLMHHDTNTTTAIITTGFKLNWTEHLSQ